MRDDPGRAPLAPALQLVEAAEQGGARVVHPETEHVQPALAVVLAHRDLDPRDHLDAVRRAGRARLRDSADRVVIGERKPVTRFAAARSTSSVGDRLPSDTRV
jgi:hypothetical protein